MTEIDGGDVGEKEEGEANIDRRTSPEIGSAPIPRKKSSARRVFFSIFRFFLVLALVAGGFFYLVERGSFDNVLKREALAILKNAVGADDYSAAIEKASVRFNRSGQIVFHILDASLRPTKGTGKAFQTKKVDIALDMLPLLVGDISISSVDIDGAGINLDALKDDESGTEDGFRIDSIPSILDKAFGGISKLEALARQAGAHELTLSGLHFDLNGTQNVKVPVKVSAISLTLTAARALTISGKMTVAEVPASLHATAEQKPDGTDNLSLVLDGFNLEPFSTLRTRENKPFIGVDGQGRLAIKAERAANGTPQNLEFELGFDKGAFYGEGEASPIRKSNVVGHYDFKSQKIEFDPSVLGFGETQIPFTGGLIDVDHLDKKTSATSGIAIDLLIQDGHAAPTNLGSQPVDFQAKAFGTFDPQTGILSAPDILVASNAGVLGGSLSVNFLKQPGPGMPGDSPEISVGLFTQKIEANAIRALWPFWFGPQARNWVYGNLFGGTITNGSLALFLPAGKLPFYPEDPVTLNAKELKIRFDIERARVSIAGDIPPMRDTIAHFELIGPKITTEIKSATAYFPSGRTVEIPDGHFEIADADQTPTIASAEFKLKGAADALAELATYRPIEALQMTGFKPSDFSGKATAALKVRFPLEGDSNVAPNWVADLDLSDIAIKPEIGGRAISGVTGHMSINPLSASLEADIAADGVPLHVSLVEPLSPDSRQKRRKRVTASLDGKMLGKLVPGLEDIISGDVSLKMELLDGNKQSVQADLSKATVSVPWAGWEKGAGVTANAKFIVRQDGDVYKISDFTFSGDGFGVAGDVVVDKAGLKSAHLSKVQLSSSDDMAMTVANTDGGYNIAIRGKSADIRGPLNVIKSARIGKDSSRLSISLSAKLATVTGFNNEVLKNVDAVFAMKNGDPVAVKLTAVTGKDQAVVAKLSADTGGKRMIDLTATDAGAFGRFTGIYEKMVGGLLNFKMAHVSDKSWQGTADIRNFKLINEDKLQRMVSTPAGGSGKSLNDAVKRNIDLSSQKFSRAFARILINGDVTSIQNGVVRGVQIGATFQGILRDGNDQMNMTGTFMPAYGLNRLFAEVPIIGLLLGNGRDRGLIGITFRLSGPYDKPQLHINPLSLIAPGVFRNIFEFH